VRILALDPGERRVGLAVSDPGGHVAVPLAVYVRRGRGDADALAAIAARECAEAIVVGLPLRLDGSRGPQAIRAERFGRAVAAVSGLPVVFWDERFSTREAERLNAESGMSRARRRTSVDATAATVILQDYLDCHPGSTDRALTDSGQT
jgi:putative Holliday junction resolvase